MTIDKAITQLERIEWPEEYGNDPGIMPAIKLGIEALKAWKQFKEGRWMSGRYDLPGETEE